MSVQGFFEKSGIECVDRVGVDRGGAGRDSG
jgi:hypothetical protein